jgi:predicted secreted acid phosphatase
MPTVSGPRYLREALAEIKHRTARGEKVAVAFDVDNTLVDTRGRVLAIGKAFDKANGTHYFKNKTAKAMGNDAKETAKLLHMTDAHARKFSALFFREFFKGENYANDTKISSTISLAKRAAAAGADVFYVTARTQSEESFTIKQLEKAGLPDVDPTHVVSKAKMRDKTTDYKANELKQLAQTHDFVPWFITESRADIAGVQKLDAPVKAVLLETKFSGDGKVDAETPIWKLDVK